MPIVKASQNLVAITCISCPPINRQKCGAEREPMGVTETALRTNDISWCWLNSCSFIFHRTKEDEGMWPELALRTAARKHLWRRGDRWGSAQRTARRRFPSRKIRGEVDRWDLWTLPRPHSLFPADDWLHLPLCASRTEVCALCVADWSVRTMRRGLRCAHYASRTEVCALTLRIPPSNVSSTTTRCDGSLQDVSWLQQ